MLHFIIKNAHQSSLILAFKSNQEILLELLEKVEQAKAQF